MSIYTNTGLVTHAKKALELPNVYMNSMILREITPAYYSSVLENLRKWRVNLDAVGYTKDRLNYLESKIVGRGYYGVDCVCLVKSYYWSGKADGGAGSPKYTASNDLNACAMYQRATVKGPIKTMPDVPGLILYSKTHPHIGIYIGNGETIESTLGSRGDGIVKKKLDSFWEYWFECPFIDYPDSAAQSAAAGSAKNEKESRQLAYPAVMRAQPDPASAQITRFPANTVVSVFPGTEKECRGPDGNIYVYIKNVWNGKEGWIVKSALE